MQLEAEEIIRIHVACDPAMEVKDDGAGFLNVIPIKGGWFEGKLSGEVVSGGADWNTRKENGISHVFAKYLLKADNGEYIAIENEGKIDNNNKTARIKTVPTFQADKNGSFAWLNTGVYVGELFAGEKKGSIEIRIYCLL